MTGVTRLLWTKGFASHIPEVQEVEPPAGGVEGVPTPLFLFFRQHNTQLRKSC